MIGGVGGLGEGCKKDREKRDQAAAAPDYNTTAVQVTAVQVSICELSSIPGLASVGTCREGLGNKSNLEVKKVRRIAHPTSGSEEPSKKQVWT